MARSATVSDNLDVLCKQGVASSSLTKLVPSSRASQGQNTSIPTCGPLRLLPEVRIEGSGVHVSPAPGRDHSLPNATAQSYDPGRLISPGSEEDGHGPRSSDRLAWRPAGFARRADRRLVHPGRSRPACEDVRPRFAAASG